jgi:hypothetical protein
MDLDEHEMMKDIMDGDVVTGKNVHAHSFDDLDETVFRKKKAKKRPEKRHEKVKTDEDGDYIDDYKDTYHKTKNDIIDALEGGKSKHRSAEDFDDEDFSEFHGRHLTEEEWKLKEKKEQENLSELIAKEKELEAAQKDVRIPSLRKRRRSMRKSMKKYKKPKI